MPYTMMVQAIFSRYGFSRISEKVGIERKTSTEWFHILPQVSKQRFDEFRANRGVSQTDTVIEYKLREEQQKAVEQAKAYFKIIQKMKLSFYGTPNHVLGKHYPHMTCASNWMLKQF